MSPTATNDVVVERHLVDDALLLKAYVREHSPIRMAHRMVYTIGNCEVEEFGDANALMLVKA